MRGEYATGVLNSLVTVELPPRARRIPTLVILLPAWVGTTSACAENTTPGPAKTGEARNYLRVRGEYRFNCGQLSPDLELPPRARRIPQQRTVVERELGTTSACAENTIHSPQQARRRRNYLRVRGEYAAHTRRGCRGMELPPRARRIPPKVS